MEGEDDAGSDPERAGSPPPIASTSRPSTPTRVDESSIEQPPATEGKDTKKLRERVAAMKPPGQEGEASNKDVEIADVAAEVSSSAAKLADEQDAKEAKDVEIAEVAAEVGATAQKMGEQDELKQEGPEGSAQANAAAEVADSAAVVQAQDERAADTAKEVAEAAAAVPEPTPAPASAKPSTSVQPVRVHPAYTYARWNAHASPWSLELCQLLLDLVPLLCFRLIGLSTRVRLDSEFRTCRGTEAQSQVGILGGALPCVKRPAGNCPRSRGQAGC